MPIRNALIRHQILLQRYARTEQQQIVSNVHNIKNVILHTPPAGRVAKLFGVKAAAVDESMNSLTDLTQYETKFITKTLTKELDIPVEEFNDPAPFDVSEIPMPLSLDELNPDDIEDIYNIYYDQVQAKLEQAQKDDTENGRGTLEKLVVGLFAAKALALASTSVNRSTNEARDAVYAANPKHINGVEWEAVLDDVTCPDCASLDGKHWTDDETPEDCPLHANCRCVLVPVLIEA